MTEKQCTACRRLLPVTEFYASSYRDGAYQSRCKACHKEITERWRQRNRDRYNAAQNRRRAMQRQRDLLMSLASAGSALGTE